MFQCIIQQRNGWIHAPNPEFRDVFPDIRLQLNEQLRCLDVRMESQISLIQELQDFFRRRGEVELDYSKSLDKLAKSLQLRHKEQKQKREQWPMFSSYACWQQLVNQTKSLSKDHAALSEIYSTHLVARLQTVCEDVQRIYRRCREIGYETHEEILRVLQELHTTMKTYHNYQTDCKEAEKKLRAAENQRIKIQQTIPKEKLERSKKYKLIEKEVLKRKNKYTDARLKALKAKNEYQLCLEASNTTIHKYFVEDLSDLIDCMDLGFHSVVSRALLMHVSADQGRCRAVLSNAETISHIVHSMDSRADKQKFLEQHHGAFMIPKRLEFQGQSDEIEPELQKALHQEMDLRLTHLEQRVNNLRMESEEIWKTLETAEINLLDILNTKDYDCSSYFGDTNYQHAKPEVITPKLRADKQEIEEFYIMKIREYILCTSRIARLDSKAEFLRTALAKDSTLQTSILVKSNVPKRKRIGRMNISGRPKLFGGSLEEYLETTGEEIPLVLRSCIRVINLFGLHHQGIFRVSGSQVEINNFKEWFERGDDPLHDTTDASDINSVAGVLKLYLRELREPLFPIIYFDQFVSLAQLESKHEIVMGIRKFLQSLPKSVVVVIRYIFAFLNHLSEYSDENMMDAYNLAICFGPTLMPAPEDNTNQVQYQNQVNELIKNIIVYHAELFPKDLGGMQYEKYISNEPFDDIDPGDSPTEQITEDLDSEVYPSEDESDNFEATAQFDFAARSDRELSLKKGDTVVLYNQVSNDWWRGAVNGKTGLVPDKYISLKIKGEDREKTSEHLKSSSSEESVRKRRPSGNISINSTLSICTQNSNTLSNITIGSEAPSATPPVSAPPNGGLSITGEQQPQQQPKTDAILVKASEQLANKSFTESPDTALYETVENVIKHQQQLTPATAPITTTKINNHAQDPKYGYHDEPHSFENSMDYRVVDDTANISHFTFEQRKRPEPIYAEPTKPSSSPLNKRKNCAAQSMNAEDESVVLRTKFLDTSGSNELGFRRSETLPNRTSDFANSDQVDYSRHSDTELLRDLMNSKSDGSDDGKVQQVTRKYHSKSFSLSENRLALETSNVFQQNRELWQKRAELSSHQSLTTPRILTRNRLAPDLVMDLPYSAISDCKTPMHDSQESLDVASSEHEDMTSAERFAAQNQSTLKKNERFSAGENCVKEIKLDTKTSDKPKAEVRPQEKTIVQVEQFFDKDEALEEVLHIEEAAVAAAKKIEADKSPIPARNTQKFVSQFADLKLTGGCLTNPTGVIVEPSSSNSPAPGLSSFKPQVKVKPHIFKKPLVLPQTPEMARRSTQD